MDTAQEILSRIINKAYNAIKLRLDDQWQASEFDQFGHISCVYDQLVNGGCAIGLCLSPNLDVSQLRGSIQSVFNMARRDPNGLAHKVIDDLGISDSLLNDVRFMVNLQYVQDCHDHALNKFDCLNKLSALAEKLNITIT